VTAAVATVYPKISEQGGRPPIPLERMLRIYFLQLWFNLSDPAVEQELYDSAAMRKFLGIDLGTESAPDETTICKFRQLLEKNKLGKTLLRAGGERVGCAGAASSAIALTQTRNFTNSGPGRNGLDIRELAENPKVHDSSSQRPEAGSKEPPRSNTRLHDA